jgi:acetyltransferase-like isoleucine patch superfamily enzyme
MRIGARAVIGSDSRRTALGVNHATILRTLTPFAELRIGEDTGISGAAICAVTSVVIGNRCLFGANVSVMDTDFHAVDSVPRRYSSLPPGDPRNAVVVSDDAFLGTGVIVLKGVTIGRGTVVAAGSVVSRDLPGMVIAAGSPAVPLSLDPPVNFGSGSGS